MMLILIHLDFTRSVCISQMTTQMTMDSPSEYFENRRIESTSVIQCDTMQSTRESVIWNWSPTYFVENINTFY